VLPAEDDDGAGSVVPLAGAVVVFADAVAGLEPAPPLEAPGVPEAELPVSGVEQAASGRAAQIRTAVAAVLKRVLIVPFRVVSGQAWRFPV